MQQATRTRRRAAEQADVRDAEMLVARSVVDLALRAGEMALMSGATASRSARLVLTITRAFELPVHVDVTYTRILVSYTPSVASDPITTMRVVRAGTLEYDRLTRLENLVRRIEDHQVDLDTARDLLRLITAEPREYRTWILLLASAVLGGAFAAFLGGGFGDQVLAAVATVLVDVVRRPLVRAGLADFFATTIGASIPAIFALALMALRPIWPHPWLLDLSPGLIVAAGMASILAGVGIVSAAIEAIEGYYITAAARTYEVLIMTLGIVLGLLIVLWLGMALGIPAYVSPTQGIWPNMALQFLSAGLIAFSFAVSCNMGPRSSLVALAMGLLLWVGYVVGRGLIDSHPAAAGIAALGVGLVARLVTRPLRIPLVALVTVGISPLMPALYLYRGVYALATGPQPGVEPPAPVLLRCAMTALALAIGTSFGATVGSVLLRARREISGHRPHRRGHPQVVGRSARRGRGSITGIN